MAITDSADMITVHPLSAGSGVPPRSFGGKGSGKAKFDAPRRLCLTARQTLLVCEYTNKRIQEVTLDGKHVRFVGAGIINDSVWSIATNNEIIVVGKLRATSNGRLIVFDANTGVYIRAFADFGSAPGQVRHCQGIRFMPDGHHIIVAEGEKPNYRLSVFTLAGEFVRCIGEGVLQQARDVEFSDAGEFIVADAIPVHRIVVFAPDGTLLREWGSHGDEDGLFATPDALAYHAGQLYVMDCDSQRVQVFE